MKTLTDLMLEDVREYYEETGEECSFDLDNPLDEEVREAHEMIERELADRGFRSMTNNCFEIREAILNDYVKENEEIGDSEIIYMDVNLSAIAETLGEIQVITLENLLGYYGTWDIILNDGMYYLVNRA